jgi:hypothetical protein
MLRGLRRALVCTPALLLTVGASSLLYGRQPRAKKSAALPSGLSAFLASTETEKEAQAVTKAEPGMNVRRVECPGRSCAPDPLPGYSAIYVSSYGSDSNNGLSWGTAKATLADALRVLPHCATTDARGVPYVLPCGKIEVAAGTLNVNSAVVITSPLISVVGRGSSSTHLTWSGGGCAVSVNVGSVALPVLGLVLPGPTFQGFSLDGVGNTNAGACGLYYTNGSHIVLRDVVISDFTASSDSCLYGATGPGSAERAVFEHVYLGNCNVGWMLQNTEASFRTIGYGDFDLYIDVGARQTGIVSVGNGQNADLRLTFSLFHVTVNGSDKSSICATLSNYSYWSDNVGVFRCDGPSSGIQIDATSYMYFGGDLDSDGGQAVANGGHLVLQETSQDPFTGNNGLIEYEQATPTEPGTGPHWDMQGQYWNSDASAADIWDFQQVPSQNSSDLVLQHVAGPADARFVTPTLEILASPSGFGGYSSTLSTPGTAYYHNTLPAASGPLVVQGADGISAGTIAMLGGTGSHTFGTPYASAPVCTGTDTTIAAAVAIASTTTTVSVAGTGSDVIAWICTPAAN